MTNPSETRDSELVREVRFLLDRLNDFEPYLEEGETFRQYAGHVSPSIERLRSLAADTIDRLTSTKGAGIISMSDPMVILAGIKQFGLASDGSDLRDLEAAIERLSYLLATTEKDATDWIEARLASAKSDTIDRLTSSGVTRGHLYDHWLVAVQCDHEAKTDTAVCSCSRWKDVPHASVGDAVKAWIDHVFAASPREGHVEVPVEPTEAETLLSLIREEAAKSNEPMGRSDSIALYNIRAALGLSRYGAALPHNQGETKP
jgi:hypothetical protein